MDGDLVQEVQHDKSFRVSDPETEPISVSAKLNSMNPGFYGPHVFSAVS